MMQSKSTIPLLMRLKEIDKKYKLKKYQEERPSSTSTETVSDDFTNYQKNLPISGSGDMRENQKQKIHIKMPITQIEPNIRAKSSNTDLESSTVIVTIFDEESPTNSDRSDTYSTSKIIINTRSIKEEIGPGGEGNIITNIDVTLHKVESDKSASISSISEVIDPEMNSIEESDDYTTDSDSDQANSIIIAEKTSLSKNVLHTDMEVSNDIFRYSDDTFEDVSSYSESVVTLKYEEEKSLEVISTKTNSNEILSSLKFQKSKSSTSNRKDSNTSEKLIEHTSLKEVHTLSEVTPNLSNELSRSINISQKLEISNSHDFPQYSLKYAQTLKSEEKKAVTDVENTTSSKRERSERRSKVELSNNLVSSKIKEKENTKIIENSTKNNCGQNKINHESELIQLYMNKSSDEQDFDDSESASSIGIYNGKKKNRSSERTLENLSKVSEEIQKKSRKKQKFQNSKSSDSACKADYLKMHGFKEKSDKKSVSILRPIKKLSENVDPTPLHQKNGSTSRNNSNNKTEYEKRTEQGSRIIKFQKIPSKIPQKTQMSKNQIDASSRCSFMLEEENQRFYKSEQQTTKPILFKPLDFPNIAGFEKPDLFFGGEVKDNNVVLLQRLFEIQSWLKDQFNLYRDYCKIVSAINQEYVPSSLVDAKKVAYELQKASEKR